MLVYSFKIKNSCLFYMDRRRVIDCFLFSNETDILLYRLKILDPIVDFFVIVEAQNLLYSIRIV